MTRVLVTGATGFVGQHLCGPLKESGYIVRAAVRSDRPLPAGATEKVVVGDMGSGTDWSDALSGVDLVVHAAARAHILNDPASSAERYFETNARGTERLAHQAAKAGVRRLVYVSTVKVNGEETDGRAYTPQDEPHPQDPYGTSKWHGEKALAQVAAGSGMEFAVLRPPLVYGPGVRANFLRLLRMVDKGLPLPLGAIDNRRSLVSVWNLCDVLLLLLESPAAAGRTWMVSDGEDLSTGGLVRRIGNAMGRRPTLLPVPLGMLRMAGRLLGRSAEIERLCGSLALDITLTRSQLGWSPPVSVDEALARTVRWYLTTR